MIYALVTSVAEQAAQPPVDYTPAIIGLSGVVVGGIIQVLAQTAKERAARVASVRADVMDFAQKAMVMADNLAELEAIREKKPYWWASLSVDELKAKSDEHTANFKAAHRAGILLAKASDPRVAEFSYQVLVHCMKFSNAREGLFGAGVRYEAVRAATHTDLRREIQVLINMVAPRKYERHMRFRSVKAAKRLVDKQRR